MIVGSMFESDDYEELQLQQHDAYRQALRIIVGHAIKRLKIAEAIVGAAIPVGDTYRRKERRYDHRDLQEAHDLIAAIWRAEKGLVHPPLPLDGFHVEKFVTEWLVWLTERMDRTCDGDVRLILQCAFGDDDDEWREAHTLLTNGLRDELGSLVKQREVVDPIVK